MDVEGNQTAFMKSRWLSTLVVTSILLMTFAATAKADPQQSAQSAPAPIDADQDPEYDGLDITRPQNRFEVRLPYRTSGTSNQTTQESALLRLDQRYDLSKMWTLGILTELPFVARQTTSPNSSSANGEFGLGDAYIEPTLVRKIDPQWSMAFGARVIGPSANDSLGTGKWQVLPILAARYEWAAELVLCTARPLCCELRRRSVKTRHSTWNCNLSSISACRKIGSLRSFPALILGSTTVHRLRDRPDDRSCRRMF